MAFILGKKLKNSQIWKDEKVIPVTLIKAVPNTVSLLRSEEKDGYSAVQIQFGNFKKEFRYRGVLKVGDEINVSQFEVGQKVVVSGRSKGKGFQGVVKRHGFAGGPVTHGQKNRLRAPGSIGSTAPQRVVPGRKMAGHMGTNRITQKNVVIADVDSENNIIFLRGAVPGARGSLVEIRSFK